MRISKLFVSLPAAVLVLTAVASADYWYGDFVGDSTVVFISQAPLYADSSLNSEVIAELPLNTAVHIIGSAGEVTLDNGMPTYWYKVEMSRSDGILTGFIPGASLAMTKLVLDENTDFLFSVTGYDPDEYAFQSSARILQDGEIADEIIFRPVDGGFGPMPYRYCVRSLPLNPEQLEGVSNLIQLSFIYEACGFLNKDVLFAWTGTELVMGPEADDQFEASEYRFIETFITPSDSGGIAQNVRVLTDISEWDEELDDYVTTDSYVTDHPWNGSVFLSSE